MTLHIDPERVKKLRALHDTDTFTARRMAQREALMDELAKADTLARVKFVVQELIEIVVLSSNG